MRQSKEDYYRSALDLLAEGGVDALTIANLCARLGVTTGSFYAHFAGIREFHTALLEQWEEGRVYLLQEQMEATPDPLDRIDLLRRMAVGVNHEAESAIRAWARTNPMVGDFQRRVDLIREDVLTQSFVDVGIDKARGAPAGTHRPHHPGGDPADRGEGRPQAPRRAALRVPALVGISPRTRTPEETAMTETLAVMASTPADYERLGLSPTVIAPWEDGARTDGSPGTYEWWYFDAYLADGAKMVVSFMNKQDIADPRKGLSPVLRLDLDLPDGRHFEKADIQRRFVRTDVFR